MASRITNRFPVVDENRMAISKRLETTKLTQGPVTRRAVLGEVKNLQTLKAHEFVDDLKKLSAVLPLKRAQFGKKENVSAVPRVLPKIETSDKLPVAMEVDPPVVIEELATAFSSQMINFSAPPAGVEDIDAQDGDNPQLLAMYVNDIYDYLWELEEKTELSSDHLAGQKITPKMRSILVDWLVQVHQRFTLLQETLYLTVSLIDRYLDVERNTTKDKLQLVGVTCMFIACKYEEMYLPEVGDFAYVTDKAFTIRDILSLEVVILNKLNFYLGFPLPLHFLRRNSKAGQVDSTQHTLAKYLMELTLTDYNFAHVKSSLIAAGALYLSMQLISMLPEWDQTLAFFSRYSCEDVVPISARIAALVLKSNTSKLTAVKTKYSSGKLMKISGIAELRPSSRQLKQLAMQQSPN